MNFQKLTVFGFVLILSTFSTVLRSDHFSSSGQTVHRFYDGQGHLFTTRYEEGAGLRYEGAPFRLLDGGANLRALYRCSSNLGTLFISADSNCEGSYQETFFGNVSRVRKPRLVPLHRWDNPHGVDSIVTLNYQEGAVAGYLYRGILGYVAKPGAQ